MSGRRWPSGRNRVIGSTSTNTNLRNHYYYHYYLTNTNVIAGTANPKPRWPKGVHTACLQPHYSASNPATPACGSCRRHIHPETANGWHIWPSKPAVIQGRNAASPCIVVRLELAPVVPVRLMLVQRVTVWPLHEVPPTVGHECQVAASDDGNARVKRCIRTKDMLLHLMPSNITGSLQQPQLHPPFPRSIGAR